MLGESDTPVINSTISHFIGGSETVKREILGAQGIMTNTQKITNANGRAKIVKSTVGRPLLGPAILNINNDCAMKDVDCNIQPEHPECCMCHFVVFRSHVVSVPRETLSLRWVLKSLYQTEPFALSGLLRGCIQTTDGHGKLVIRRWNESNITIFFFCKIWIKLKQKWKKTVRASPRRVCYQRGYPVNIFEGNIKSKYTSEIWGKEGLSKMFRNCNDLRIIPMVSIYVFLLEVHGDLWFYADPGRSVSLLKSIQTHSNPCSNKDYQHNSYFEAEWNIFYVHLIKKKSFFMGVLPATSNWTTVQNKLCPDRYKKCGFFLAVNQFSCYLTI